MATTLTKATEVAFTISLDSASNGAVVTSSTVTPALTALDHHIRVTVAQIVPTGATQLVVVYAVLSNEGTTFSDSNHVQNRKRLGYIALTGMGQARSGHFSLAEACGGFPATAYKLVCENLSGVGLAATGNSAGYVAVGIA